ncbi:hypothetical protein J4E86_010462 [Alternaria arbusti]|uniref:uncharacterized protein n=1 Tax=Alternaria arbusti TaxID=232088 RepID=UPI00221F9866|nr:uncharacterized protein J4E86_010462 [Alternaria arbusti]KAI4941429.1 hypothetical protein J4E86_010462 [Alternaria arbusti]
MDPSLESDTSEKCGYIRAITEPEPQQKAPRKRGKAGKARKPAKKTPDPVTPAQYPIRVSEFVEMAEHIASFDPKIEVPAALQKALLLYHRSEKAAKLLKPLIPETPVVSENIKLQNRFAGLTVEETDPLDELITEVKEK